MCLKSSASQQSIVTLLPDTGDMLPQRCPSCGCAEEGAARLPLRFHLRLQRTARLISVALVLLLGLALGTMVLLLFGPPPQLRQSEAPSMLNAPAAPAVSEKLQSKKDPSHPSALLTIRPDSQLVWQSIDENSHIRGNMKYECEKLHVPSTGLYRVYLQITFDFESETHNHSDLCVGDELQLQISVERFSESYPNFRALLKSKNTMSCNHDWSRTMFTSGTFVLEADTKLRVQVQHPQLVFTDNTSSFFGVELISAL